MLGMGVRCSGNVHVHELCELEWVSSPIVEYDQVARNFARVKADATPKVVDGAVEHSGRKAQFVETPFPGHSQH